MPVNPVHGLTPIRDFERHAWLPSRRLCMLKMDSFRGVMLTDFIRIGAYAWGVLWYGANRFLIRLRRIPRA